jgi:transposase
MEFGGEGVAQKFYPCDRDQLLLMPPSLEEWLGAGHLARFLRDAVETMDLSALYKGFRDDGLGGTAYDPRMMTEVFLYGYCVGIRSSRKIEKECDEDVAFRFLAVNHRPDHTTLARFRADNEKVLERLFTDVLRLCKEAGLVKVGVVALDGTKIRANAALAANKTLDTIHEEVKRLLAEAKKTDEEEDRSHGKDKRGDELPADLAEGQSRIARLLACKQRLEEQARESVKKQADKVAKWEKAEQENGQAPRGRKPKAPQEAVDTEAKANVTDPESRIMKTRKGFIQGYNAQAVVTERQIIIAAEVTQEENDQGQLKPMMGAATATLAKIGIKRTMGTALADAGYGCEKNLHWATDGRKTTDFLIATLKDWKQRKALRDEPTPVGRCPQGMNARDRMERKLRTRRGRRLYKKRACTVEPTFGQVKTVQGFEGFSRRGMRAAQSEWKIIGAAHNLLKLWRSGARIKKKI